MLSKREGQEATQEVHAHLINEALGLRPRSVFRLVWKIYRCAVNHPPGSTRR
jgi:hypothetical protein